MSWSGLLADLDGGRRQLDRLSEKLSAGEDDRFSLFCGKGCGNCCSLAVNCSFPEAVAIAQSLSDKQRQQLADRLPPLRQISLQAESLVQFLRQFRQQLGGCPFLATDGSCDIYPLRPFSCRALLSTRNHSWCAVDFADLHPQEKEAFLSSLDPEVVAFPTHYLAESQELGLELEARSLVAMRDEFGVALSGNLLYQVWLETEYRLSDVLSKGFNEARSFLAQRQLDLPFLLQLQGGSQS